MAARDWWYGGRSGRWCRHVRREHLGEMSRGGEAIGGRLSERPQRRLLHARRHARPHVAKRGDLAAKRLAITAWAVAPVNGGSPASIS